MALVSRAFQANIDMNPIGPDVNVLSVGKIALTEFQVLLVPFLLETNDRVGERSVKYILCGLLSWGIYPLV